MKWPWVAKDHAVEECVYDCDFELIRSRLNEICDVGLIRTQQKSSSGFAIDCNLGDVSYVTEVKDESSAGHLSRNSETGGVGSPPGESAKFTIERPIHQ